MDNSDDNMYEQLLDDNENRDFNSQMEIWDKNMIKIVNNIKYDINSIKTCILSDNNMIFTKKQLINNIEYELNKFNKNINLCPEPITDIDKKISISEKPESENKFLQNRVEAEN